MSNDRSGPLFNPRAGFIEEYRFPDQTRSMLELKLGADDRGREMLRHIESVVASQIFTNRLDSDEPRSRGALRKELKAWICFCHTTLESIEGLSHSAIAAMRGHQGVSSHDWRNLHAFFQLQELAARQALANLPPKVGRERESMKYMYLLIQIARRFENLFGRPLSHSKRGIGYCLAQAALEGAGMKVSGGQLEKALKAAKKELTAIS